MVIIIGHLIGFNSGKLLARLVISLAILLACSTIAQGHTPKSLKGGPITFNADAAAMTKRWKYREIRKQFTEHGPGPRNSYLYACKMLPMLDKLFPLHGCDISLHHKSLLDCFASGEARMDPGAEFELEYAYQLHEAKVPLYEIQKRMLEKFPYVYGDQKSPDFLEYEKKYLTPHKR